MMVAGVVCIERSRNGVDRRGVNNVTEEDD